MINIETLLSSFDERGTLLKWLKAVEKALNEATLTSVDVITISTQQIQLQFNFEDGTHLTTPTITLPKGDKGDTGETGATGQTGATGVGVSNVTVNASNHLIVTLTDETEIDAGEINVTSGVVIDTSLSVSSENPVQNKVIYTALAGKQDVIDATHKLSADNVDDSTTANKFVTSAEKSQITTNASNITSLQSSKQDVIDATHKLSADNVDDSATTNKFVTNTEKSTWNGKQNALTTTSVNDGTIDKSIGFDSQGNIVKGSAGGGGSGINGYTLTYDIAQGILSSLFLEYLYVDGNGNIKSDEILFDGTHKSGTLTNVLMVRYNSTGLNPASISGSNFDVCIDYTNLIYTVWLTDNRQYNAQSGGGGGN